MSNKEEMLRPRECLFKMADIAAELGCSTSTLYRRLREWGVRLPRWGRVRGGKTTVCYIPWDHLELIRGKIWQKRPYKCREFRSNGGILKRKGKRKRYT